MPRTATVKVTSTYSFAAATLHILYTKLLDNEIPTSWFFMEIRKIFFSLLKFSQMRNSSLIWNCK